MNTRTSQSGLYALQLKNLLGKKLVLAVVACLFAARGSQAAGPFQEVGGQVVIEAEHFETRANDPDGRHHWHIVPTEDGTDSFMDFGVISETTGGSNNIAGVIPGARGDSYIQAVPASGQGKTLPADVGAPPYVTYLVKIATTGSYRLWLRYGGLDGNSDVMYAEIVELRADRGGPGPNWWRYRRVAGADFTNVPWDNRAIQNDNGGGGNNADATWNIATPGTYTIRLTYREDGMMVDSLILQLASLAAPTLPGPPESARISDFVTLKTSPAPQDGVAGGTATFSVQFDASGPLSYQWQRADPGSTNFTDIAGANSASYTTPTLAVADNGAQYRARAFLTANPNLSGLSAPALLQIDVVPPTIVKVMGSAGFDSLRITFSEPMDAATAQVATNYQLSGGIISSNATLINSNTVVLVTSAQPQNTNLTLTVSNVADDSPGRNPIAANSTFIFKTFNLSPNFVTVEFFEGWPGRTIEDFIAGNAKFPSRPDSVQFRTVFGSSVDFRGEDFAGRLRAFFVPQVTGDYVFFLAADDAGQLFLSTDENSANKHLIAEDSQVTPVGRRAWTGGASRDPTFPQNRSDTFPNSPSPRAVAKQNLWPVTDQATGGALIHLVAGNRYHIEAIQKEGVGGDFLEATAKLSTDPDPANGSTELSGPQVAAFTDPNGVSLTLANQPQNQTIPAGTRIAFAPVATVVPAGTPVFYQWRTNGQAIPGATAPAYTTGLLGVSDSGKKYSLFATTLGGVNVTTPDATITVSSNSTPPAITTTFASKSFIRVTVRFSVAMDASAAVVGNYSLKAGATVVPISTATATLDSKDHTRVVLTTDPAYAAGQALQLTVSGLKDLSGNVLPNTTVTVGPAAQAILFVAGTIPPNAADTAAITSLTDDFNFEVTAMDDGVATTADADGKDLVIGSSTSGAAQIGGFYFVPQPVLFWESGAEDEFLFTGATAADQGALAGQTSIDIVLTNHPLAAGFSAGIHTITTNAQSFSWGAVNPLVQATVVARIAGSTNQAVIYAVETNAVLIDGVTTAPARRVFFALSDNTFPSMNSTGRVLFNAAVHYAMGIPYTPPPPIVTLSVTIGAGGNLTISWNGSGTLVSANALTGPWVPVPGAASPYPTTASGLQRFFRVMQ